MSEAIRLERSPGYRPGDPEWHDHDALALDARDTAALSDTEVLAALVSLHKLRARAGAVETSLLARFDRLRNDALGAEDEVAYTLRITRHQAADRIAQARQLVRRHPMLLDAMYGGDVEPYPASRVLDITAALDDEQARRVDERLDGRLAGKNPTDVRRIARRAVQSVDPDGQLVRARRARTGRRVELLPGEDTMSRLIADLPAEAASAAYASIDTEARRLRRRGEHRSLDQLRADILTDRLIRPGGTASPGAMVYLHMPIDAALGIGDDGCELAGYGPVPGAIARHIMGNENSVWRKVICDPATGAPLDLGRRRYRPNTAIREIIHARDRECAIPGCHRTAQHCEYDHVHSHATGGDTSVTNGESACKYHNNLKEQPGWRIDFDHGANAVTITTPTGQRITRTRRPVLTPRQRSAGSREPTGPPEIPAPRAPAPDEPPPF